MDPKIWGNNLWISLIHIAQGYPDNPDQVIQNQYNVFLNYLSYVLPCASCQINYKNHLKESPPDLRNSETLLHWLHQIYNRTLIQQGRKEVTFIEFMTKHGANNTSTSSNFSFFTQRQLLIIMLVLALIFAGYCYYANKKGKV